ncbi:MAG: invasion associated locus B family protein [Rhodospirillales bacterium]
MTLALLRRSTRSSIALSLTLLLGLPLLLAGQSRAAEFDSYTELGVFRDWVAYEAEAQGQKTCLMVSIPQTMDRRLPTRQTAAVRAVVVHRPAQGVRGEVLIETGFPIATNVQADVTIDQTDFKMATDTPGLLWLPTRYEAAFIAAMRRGITMVTKVASGNQTISDTYSLRGFTAALRAIDEACP